MSGPTTTSTQRVYVDTLVLQVYALTLRQHRRQLLSKRNTPMPCMSGRMQANGLVPYLLSATNTVLRIKLYRTILTQRQKSGNPSTLVPNKQRHSHPNPPLGRWDFPCPFVKHQPADTPAFMHGVHRDLAYGSRLSLANHTISPFLYQISKLRSHFPGGKRYNLTSRH